MQLGGRYIQDLSSDEGALPRLIVDQLATINRKSRGNGPVKEIWLGKAKHDVALKAAEVGLYGERFTQPQEIVGAVAQSNERSGQAAYAAGKSDLILAPLVDLEGQIHQARLLIQMPVGDVGIIRFQLLKESELVEPL